jgi:hypothetical protein
MYRKFRVLDLDPFVYYLGFVCMDLNERGQINFRWKYIMLNTMIFTGKNKKPIVQPGVLVVKPAFPKYNMFEAIKAKKCGSCPALNH